MTRLALIGSDPDENNQGLRCYSFMVNLDYIYVIEIVMLLMIHPVENVFQTKRDDVNLNYWNDKKNKRIKNINKRYIMPM